MWRLCMNLSVCLAAILLIKYTQAKSASSISTSKEAEIQFCRHEFILLVADQLDAPGVD